MTADSPTPAPAPGSRGATEQARLDAALIDFSEHRITVNQLLGLKIDTVAPGDVRSRFAMRPELIDHHSHGRLHGSVISSMLDAMGGLALMVVFAARHPADNTLQVMQRFIPMGTINLRVHSLHQGLGQHFVAIAEVLRLGSRVGSTQMRLVNDAGILIAAAAAACSVA